MQTTRIEETALTTLLLAACVTLFLAAVTAFGHA